jgi:aminopeptidase-like protein
MRSKHGEYPEYHTSLDNLDFISPEGLYGSYQVMQKIIDCLERNSTYSVNVLCEPQLGKRGLYPTVSTKASNGIVRDMMNVLAYCDGTNDLIEIADRVELPVWDIYGMVDSLDKCDLFVKHGVGL